MICLSISASLCPRGGGGRLYERACQADFHVGVISIRGNGFHVYRVLRDIFSKAYAREARTTVATHACLRRERELCRRLCDPLIFTGVNPYGARKP